MFFRYELTVRELGLTPTSEHYPVTYLLVLNYGDVRVEIRPPTEAETEAGHDAWVTFADALGQYEPSKRVGPMFESLECGELPEGSTPDRNRSYFDARAREASGEPHPAVGDHAAGLRGVRVSGSAQSCGTTPSGRSG
jgi:hypothetical protein